MSKNFLLSKGFALTLTAVVLNSLVASAWSMNNEDDQSHFSIQKKNLKNDDNNTEEKNKKENNKKENLDSANQNHFTKCPKPIIVHILKFAAFGVGGDKKNLSNLALVCKYWNNIVNNKNEFFKQKVKKSYLKGWYAIKDRKQEEAFKTFYNGILIYRPDLKTDKEMITLKISDFKNPLQGTFDLSMWKVGEYVRISTGYPTKLKPENANKLEIWIAPRFLIEKDLNTTAKHFQKINSEWGDAPPVGIFWTWGGCNDLKEVDCLISESTDNISKKDLYQHWCSLACTSDKIKQYVKLRLMFYVNQSKHFMFIL